MTTPRLRNSILWATFIAGLLPALALLLSIQTSHAGSATWLATPATADWNTAANWTAGGPPNGSADTATFAISNITNLSLSLYTEVNGILFNAGASQFTITVNPFDNTGQSPLTVSGVGITNNSGITQNFVTTNDSAGNGGTIAFTNSATAGSLTTLTITANNLGSLSPNSTNFFITSTAGSATINNNGASVAGGSGGETAFFQDSTAGSATITNDAGHAVGNVEEAITYFFTNATAGSATITNNASTVSGEPNGGTVFENNSTAGEATITNNGALVIQAAGGITNFSCNTCTAGNATITNNDGADIGGAGKTQFGSATAGSATINNNGGTFSGAVGGITLISGADGGSATINNNGGAVSGAIGGSTTFQNNSDADSATLIANGGVGGGGGGLIQFMLDATGGTARVEVFDNGMLDISGTPSSPGVNLTTGSIEGSGLVFLGGYNLTVGGNNLSTIFSGVIQDGGIGGGTGGSLTKTGGDKLTLSNANTYTGGTTVSRGTLLVTNRTGSATGTGPVQVNTGTLGGAGTISGAVTLGTGRRSGAILLPAKSATAPSTLTIDSALTFNSLSTYKCVLNRRTVKASKATAFGVTINSGASFTFVDVGTGVLAVGTVFTVINNTSANSISGTFSNLANGSVFTSNGNNFQASYTGGSGNDLTLTVVP